MAVSIREATVDDVTTLLTLIKEIAEFEKLAHMVQASEESLTKHLFGDKPAAEAIIIESDNQVAGFAIFFTTFSTFTGCPGLWLDDLFIKEEFRSKGAGSAALKYLANLALEREYKRFEWMVLDWNEPAIVFYKKIGAEFLNDWKICRLSGDGLKEFGAS